MNIAIINNGQVTQVGDYRALFPNTSFPPSGPNDSFLSENNAMKVNVWKEYNPATEKLVGCEPYIENGWVYTVTVQALTPEEIAERNIVPPYRVTKDTITSRVLEANKLPDLMALIASLPAEQKFLWEGFSWFWNNNQTVRGMATQIGLDPEVILAPDPYL